MTHFMAYVVLLSAGISACALLVDHVLRSRLSATRWVWVSALAGVLIVAGIASFAPLPVMRDVTTTVGRVPEMDAAKALPGPVTTDGAVSRAVLRVTDGILPTLWLVSSVLLLAAILYGQRRLSIERAVSRKTKLNGREVLLTDNVGPAVAGVGRPAVLLPRWALALDVASQELLLAHEFEHVEQGDTRVLLTGAVAAALMPWNPVAWWIARRLRLAVEQDCDARVLRAYPDVRRYADLLLMAASQPRVSTRLLAAHFGEHRSDLDRRIQAMTDKRLRWRRALATAVVAVALVAVSCEAPRPAPLAPMAKDAATPQVVSPGDVLYEFQVEKPVTMASGSATPKYPEILKQAGVEGEVLASFVVNEEGIADPASLKVIRSTHELFATAVKQALPSMRFTAAEVGGRKVKQLVQQPFSFSLPGDESRIEKLREVPLAAGKVLAFSVDRSLAADSGPKIMYRADPWPEAAPVYFEILSSGGAVVSRYASSRMPSEVRVDDISSIEVLKPAVCPASVKNGCPLIRITLKPGRESAYRKR